VITRSVVANARLTTELPNTLTHHRRISEVGTDSYQFRSSTNKRGQKKRKNKAEYRNHDKAFRVSRISAQNQHLAVHGTIDGHLSGLVSDVNERDHRYSAITGV